MTSDKLLEALVRLAVEAGAEPERARERMAQIATGLIYDLTLANETRTRLVTTLHATEYLLSASELALAETRNELANMRPVVEEARHLRDSGYDGPFIGDAVAPLLAALRRIQ